MKQSISALDWPASWMGCCLPSNVSRLGLSPSCLLHLLYTATVPSTGTECAAACVLAFFPCTWPPGHCPQILMPSSHLSGTTSPCCPTWSDPKHHHTFYPQVTLSEILEPVHLGAKAESSCAGLHWVELFLPGGDQLKPSSHTGPLSGKEISQGLLKVIMVEMQALAQFPFLGSFRS